MFVGRHYETGTLANALGCKESLVLGASGGIAFGCFIFEYSGHLPHVALLTRNTFSPFERALDNLGVRRTLFETVKPDKGVENLRRELDFGHTVIAWADAFSLRHSGLDPTQMWMMRPVHVLGYEGDDYLIADGAKQPIAIPASEFEAARARVKKDRFRIITVERPDEAMWKVGLASAIETCADLYLDKPAAAAAHNFGIAGLRHWAKMLRDKRTAQSWTRRFEPGPKLVQALAGTYGQPGVWSWIETWGTEPAADRGTFAAFLRDAAGILAIPDLNPLADLADSSAGHWSRLADQAMPDAIPQFEALKRLRRAHRDLRYERGRNAVDELAAMRAEMHALIESLSSESTPLADLRDQILDEMAATLDEIGEVEARLATGLRNAVS